MTDNKTKELVEEAIKWFKDNAYEETEYDTYYLQRPTHIKLALHLFQEKLKSCEERIFVALPSGLIEDFDNPEYLQIKECITYLEGLLK